MKKVIYLSLITLLIAVQSVDSIAQTRGSGRQQGAQQGAQQGIKQGTRTAAELSEFKFQYIVSTLGLSEAKLAKFTSIYKAYRAAIDAKLIKRSNEVACMQLLDDKELTATMLANFKNISAIADIKAEYVSKFAKVLTARQIHQLYKAEGKFSKRLKETHQRRSNRNSRGWGNSRGNSMCDASRGASAMGAQVCPIAD